MNLQLGLCVFLAFQFQQIFLCECNNGEYFFHDLDKHIKLFDFCYINIWSFGHFNCKISSLSYIPLITRDFTTNHMINTTYANFETSKYFLRNCSFFAHIAPGHYYRQLDESKYLKKLLHLKVTSIRRSNLPRVDVRRKHSNGYHALVVSPNEVSRLKNSGQKSNNIGGLTDETIAILGAYYLFVFLAESNKNDETTIVEIRYQCLVRITKSSVEGKINAYKVIWSKNVSRKKSARF